MAGKLFVVATPLGNLQDLSQRAIETLRTVERIACEDTRRTAGLLARWEIRTPTLSCHRFNERERLDDVLSRLQAGERIALVSDGGTPGICDPGGLLIRAAREAGIPIEPVPGPCALSTLLSVSGLPADRFVFEGFLPHRAGERRRRLRELRSETRTVVFYEAPHRLAACLQDLAEIVGDRPLVLGRELTKVHETILCGSAGSLQEALGETVRGEITVALAGAPPGGAEAATVEPEADRLLACWRETLTRHDGSVRPALREAARRLGLKRAELYRRLNELGEPV